MSAYFYGIKVGDKVYRLNDPEPWEVRRIFLEDKQFSVSHTECDHRFVTFYGKEVEYGGICSSHVWFWQPVHIDAPPRPKRWKKITLEPTTLQGIPPWQHMKCSILDGHPLKYYIVYERPAICGNFQHPTCEVEK
jgi:hypothetical protein